MKKIIGIVLVLWQLPQFILGLLMLAVYARGEAGVEFGKTGFLRPSSIVFLSDRMPSGISLGPIIIIGKPFAAFSDMWLHEYGHSVQSVILGPSYLLIIGLPSLLWAAWWNAGRKVDYYWFWTEAWADRLGGVER